MINNNDEQAYKEHCNCANWMNYLHAPGHHFIDVTVGEFIMNSSVLGSKVAVVSSSIMLVPAHSISKILQGFKHSKNYNHNLSFNITADIKVMLLSKTDSFLSYLSYLHSKME
jgi:hypothetical protein